MHILDKIINAKRREIELKKSVRSRAELEETFLFDRPVNSLAARLSKSKSGIIAEHKRRSPSKPMINTSLSVEEVVKGYDDAGVCGISVLTDSQFFGGTTDDLLLARAATKIPLLRKEFILDPYQLYEAKAFGADAVLLIASALSAGEIINLAGKAQELELEVLLEVHNEEELEKAFVPGISMIGVNNRDLKSFEVDLQTSIKLGPMIPEQFVKVSESGLKDAESIQKLKISGFQGFLIGESFMKTEHPGKTAAKLVKELEQ